MWLPSGCRHLDITTTRELNEVKEGLQLAFIEQMVTRDQMYITSTVRPEALVIMSGTLVGVLGFIQKSCTLYSAAPALSFPDKEGLRRSRALAVDWSSIQVGDSGPGRFSSKLQPFCCPHTGSQCSGCFLCCLDVQCCAVHLCW